MEAVDFRGSKGLERAKTRIQQGKLFKKIGFYILLAFSMLAVLLFVLKETAIFNDILNITQAPSHVGFFIVILILALGVIGLLLTVLGLDMARRGVRVRICPTCGHTDFLNEFKEKHLPIT